MLFFIFFGRCRKNCSIARKKLLCPTLGGLQPPPQLIRLCTSTNRPNRHKLTHQGAESDRVQSLISTIALYVHVTSPWLDPPLAVLRYVMYLRLTDNPLKWISFKGISFVWSWLYGRLFARNDQDRKCDTKRRTFKVIRHQAARSVTAAYKGLLRLTYRNRGSTGAEGGWGRTNICRRGI